jgi:hypothetical protein
MNGKHALCRPAKAGAAAGGITGLIIWALVAYIPAFHNGVPAAVTDVLPFALAWIGHVLTTWLTAHHVPVPPAAGPASGRSSR